MTVLDSLPELPFLTRESIVGHFRVVPPRLRNNLDGSTSMARTCFVFSSDLWLIVISPGEKRPLYKVRVYLRYIDDSDPLLLAEDDGFVTPRGAEWAAHSALLRVIRDVKKVREAAPEEEVESQ